MKKTSYWILHSAVSIGLLTTLPAACSTGSSPNKAAIESRIERFQKLKANLSLPVADRVKQMPVDLMEATQAFDKSIGIVNVGLYQARAATSDELTLIKSYIALLPPAHQAVFTEKLLAIYLIDNFQGAGLTD